MKDLSKKIKRISEIESIKFNLGIEENELSYEINKEILDIVNNKFLANDLDDVYQLRTGSLREFWGGKIPEFEMIESHGKIRIVSFKSIENYNRRFFTEVVYDGSGYLTFRISNGVLESFNKMFVKIDNCESVESIRNSFKVK